MRSSVLFCLVPVALWAAASPSPANVTISNAATANMTCSGGVCAPTATDAVLNVQDLEAMLASGNAMVTTTGAGIQASNIHVNAKLSWSAAMSLSLDAFRSIELDAKVSVAGAGGVSLTTNNGGGGGEFACNDNGRLAFSNLSSALTINGTPYVLVNSVASLASTIAASPSGAFAFASSYDAKRDGTYTSSPISTVFTGSFDGLGNTISNLSINDPTENSYVGLFAEIATGSTISNIRLLNENVQGGSGNSASPNEAVGGLVGSAGGTVVHGFNTGTVSAGDDASAGGLLGLSEGITTGSGSAAAVSATGSESAAGGLVGISENASIRNSSATGSVSGNAFAGGLVGFSDLSTITHSGALGPVTSVLYAGGLVGDDVSGAIDESYASGAVTCQTGCGGLVGFEQAVTEPAKISCSFATGTVTAATSDSLAGGLVGWNQLGELSNSYATGAVSAMLAGGLVGQNQNYSARHSIVASYATGAISASSDAGGLVGYDDTTFPSDIKRTYWDMTTSGITNASQGAGNVANDPGMKGLSDTKLKSGLPKGFDPKIWSENANISGGLPYLIANPPAN